MKIVFFGCADLNMALQTCLNFFKRPIALKSPWKIAQIQLAGIVLLLFKQGKYKQRIVLGTSVELKHSRT